MFLKKYSYKKIKRNYAFNRAGNDAINTIPQICIGNTHNYFTIPFHASIACNKFIVYNETILYVGSHKKIELDEFCLPSIRQKLIFCPLSLLSSPLLQVLLFLSFIQSKYNKFVKNTQRFGPGLVQYLTNPDMASLSGKGGTLDSSDFVSYRLVAVMLR